MTDKPKETRTDLALASKSRAIAEKILLKSVLGTIAGRLALDEIIEAIEVAANQGAVRVIIEERLMVTGMKPFLEAKGYTVSHLGKQVQIVF